MNWRFCLQLRVRRNRHSGNSHNLLGEHVGMISKREEAPSLAWVLPPLKMLAPCISEPLQMMVGHWMQFAQVLCACPQWTFEFYLSINGPEHGPESGPTNAKITLTWLPHQMRIGPLSLSTRTGSVLPFRTLMASPSVDVPILGSICHEMLLRGSRKREQLNKPNLEHFQLSATEAEHVALSTAMR